MKITCSMCTAKWMTPCRSYKTQFESFLIINCWKKIFETQSQMLFHVILEWREWCLRNVREPLECLPLARDVARHFQCHKSRISRLLNRFQQTGNAVDRPKSGRPHNTMPWEDHFLTTSSLSNRFLSTRKLGHLLRNGTDSRVCDRTVRNRLHAARLKACRPYVGIPLTWRNYQACWCIVFATT